MKGTTIFLHSGEDHYNGRDNLVTVKVLTCSGRHVEGVRIGRYIFVWCVHCVDGCGACTVYRWDSVPEKRVKSNGIVRELV